MICAVSGPRAISSASTASSSLVYNIDNGLLDCDVKFAPFVNSGGDVIRLEKCLSRSMRDSLRSSVKLSNYPKSSFTINCIILQTSKDDLAALINAGSMALADASIELLDLVSAYSVTRQSIRSFDASFEDGNEFVATFSFMLSSGSLTDVHLEGRIDTEMVLKCSSFCRQICSMIREQMNSALKQKLSQKGALK